MKVKIGKLLPDGRIRYIEVSVVERKKIAAKLKTFYSIDKRLDALLDLGNLVYIGSSPNGRFSGINDPLHCCSEIRDNKKSPNKHAAQIVRNREAFFNPKENCFLFENGTWTVQAQKENSLSHLTAYVINDKGFSRKWISDTTWNQLTQEAKKENESYYFFNSQNKLVANILKTQLQ
jgi:hypothetical protein